MESAFLNTSNNLPDKRAVESDRSEDEGELQMYHEMLSSRLSMQAAAAARELGISWNIL